MPIRATFTGDITDLRRGTQQAREEFRKVGTEAQGAARQLRAVGSGFDGSKLEGQANRIASGITRIGGAARLTDSELSRNSRIITEVLQKYERMGVEAPAHIRRVANELRSAQAAARELQTTSAGIGATLSRGGGALLGGLGLGIGAGAGLGAITAIGAAVSQMASDGARMAPLAQAFERLQGGAVSASRELTRLRQETRGLVSDTDLMRGANQAAQLKLSEMGVDFGKLAGAAVTLGRAVGNEATKSIDDLVGALGRGSTEVLDNLGITLKVAEAQEIYADRIGKTVTQLTDQEKKQAFVTIGLERAIAAAEKLGEVQLTTTEQATRIATALGDMGAAMFSAGNQSVTLAGQLGQVADVLDRIRNASPGEVGNVIATEISRAGARLGEASERAVNNAPWYLRALAEGGVAPARLAGAVAGFAAPYFGNTNFASLGGNPLAPTIPAMSAPGGAAARISGAGSVADLNAAREALGRLTAAQRDAIRAAKELGASNKEAATAAGTTEAVVRLFEAQATSAKKAGTEAGRLAAELAKLTGADIVGNAVTLAQNLEKVGTANILPASMPALVEQLTLARNRASELGPEFAGAVAQIDGKLRDLVSSPAYRDFFQRSLRNPDIGVNRGLENPAFTRTGIAGAIIPDLNPFPRTTIPGSFDTFDAAGRRNSIAGITVDFQKGIPAIRSWRTELKGVAQAFAQLAQIAGPSLNGVTRGLGTVISSVDAAGQLVESLSSRFPSLSENVLDANGNVIGTRLSGRGRAIAGSIGAFATGAQLGSMTSNPWLGAALGAGGGAAVGAMSGPILGLTAGATIGLTAGIGAAAAIYMAWRNRQAEKKALSEQRAQVIASAGGYEKFREAVEGAGFEFDHFLTKFNSNNSDVFTEGMNQLNVALAEQTTRAAALTKGLNEVARVNGVLSLQQIAQIRNMAPGDPGADAVLQFAEQQRQAGEQGIIGAASALAQMASLTQEELEALTAGITDAAERQRVIDAELRRRAADTLDRFGSAAQGTAAGLFVAFTSAVDAGENALDVLRRLAPSIESIQQLYQRAGLTPGAGFQQLQIQSAIATGPQTGPALQLAQGLGQALAAYANTGLLSPELFGELANGIGQAYKQLELLGQGGLEAARLMQPSLQAIWQMVQDNPALRNQLDGTTLSLLEFAEQAGLIGEAFRPAIDQMIAALNDLIAKLDEFINRIGQIPGMPPLTPPGDPGDPAAPPGEPPPGTPPPPGEPDPGTPGTPSNPNPPANGGDYTQGGLRLASTGGANPGDIVPLSRSGATSAPLQITVISQIDGYEAARAITRRQPDVYRTYGAA